MNGNGHELIERKAEPSQDQYDFYKKLRSRINAWLQSKEGASHKWVKYLIWAPDLFHLLVKLSMDEAVPPREKAKVAMAVAYFVSPIDLVPEGFFGPVGYLDDIALAAYVLNSILSSVGPETLRRHWAGDTDVLVVIRTILKAADKMVGSGVWEKLQKRL